MTNMIIYHQRGGIRWQKQENSRIGYLTYNACIVDIYVPFIR